MTEISKSEIENFPKEVEFGVNLARKITDSITHVYGVKEKDVPINQISHDYNYAVDRLAEDVIKKQFQELWDKGIYWGYVTEDQGLVQPEGHDAEIVFMIDPVDGSRIAQIGAENATVTMVAVDGKAKDPTFKDIKFGVTHAIKEDKTFVCEKGKGVWEISNSQKRQIVPRKNAPEDLKDCSLVYETYSMSPMYTGVVIEPLVAEISFKTEFPSGSYSALTLVRGQNEIHVDLRKRLTADYPNLQVALKPNSKSVFPMDIAAGWLMIRELGGKVTDASGLDIDNKNLWEFNEDGSWSGDNEISWVATINPDLHEKVMKLVENGFRDLKTMEDDEDI